MAKVAKARNSAMSLTVAEFSWVTRTMSTTSITITSEKKTLVTMRPDSGLTLAPGPVWYSCLPDNSFATVDKDDQKQPSSGPPARGSG